MISCGIWPDGKKLVVVVLDDAGRARKPILVSRTERAAEALVIYLAEDLAAEIVLVDTCLKRIGRAFVRSERVWVAPAAVVEPIRYAAALSPRAAAAMLARLPRIPALRSQLRRPACDPRQLTLL